MPVFGADVLSPLLFFPGHPSTHTSRRLHMSILFLVQISFASDHVVVFLMSNFVCVFGVHSVEDQMSLLDIEQPVFQVSLFLISGIVQRRNPFCSHTFFDWSQVLDLTQCESAYSEDKSASAHTADFEGQP